jgi:hypothetical protein
MRGPLSLTRLLPFELRHLRPRIIRLSFAIVFDPRQGSPSPPS